MTKSHPAPARTSAATPPLALQITDLVKTYAVRGGLAGGRTKATLTAVDGVSLAVPQGKTLGLVGESGSGKSTVAKLLVAVEKPTSGSISVLGREIQSLSGAELRRARRDIQLVFQDPYTSLDPRLTVANIVGEPLAIHSDAVPRRDRKRRIADLLDMVGLGDGFAERLPHQLSGGQRQRVGIARALALSPKILVLDEPVSALDMSVQAQIINLLTDLQKELGLAYVFIAHDLGVVAQLVDQIAVMYLGRIVEQGSYQQVFGNPAHPFTMALLSAIPEPDPAGRPNYGRRLLAGETPSPIALPSGCRFRTRCWRATEECSGIEPTLAPQPDSAEHLAACYHPGQSRVRAEVGATEPITAGSATAPDHAPAAVPSDAPRRHPSTPDVGGDL
jgi:oligopeptide/dipeptide ABC transporter ATP-binding protein